MIRNIIIAITMLLFTAAAFAGDTEIRFKSKKSHNIYRGSCIDNIDIDLDDGILTFSGRHRSDPTVEITEDYELYINGDHIKVTKQQKGLLGEYYVLNMQLIEEAKQIGLYGAEIGIEGAKIGLKAITSLFYLLDDDYDIEDYEREIEEKAEKLELKADQLEERADDLEQIADDLEDMYDELEEEITELGELEWY